MINLILDILESLFDSPLDSAGTIIYIIMCLITFIGILLALRNLKCWYWKINNITAEQKRQTEVLQNILNTLSKQQSTQTASGAATASEAIKKDSE